jgi:DNA mismatch repair ATPase MutS
MSVIDHDAQPESNLEAQGAASEPIVGGIVGPSRRIMIPPQHAQERLVFLYKLVPGYATCSFALSCARQVGVCESVIDRARYISDCLSNSTPIDPVTSSLLSRGQAQPSSLTGDSDFNGRKHRILKAFRDCASADSHSSDSAATSTETAVDAALTMLLDQL